MENLQITLWVNEYKKEDKQPDYKAQVKIGDKFEECGAGWKKTSPTSGKKFLSLSFKTEVLKQAIAAQNPPELTTQDKAYLSNVPPSSGDDF